MHPVYIYIWGSSVFFQVLSCGEHLSSSKKEWQQTFVSSQEKYAQLQAVEEEQGSKPAVEKGPSEKFSMEGKEADLAAIMDSMWGSSRF